MAHRFHNHSLSQTFSGNTKAVKLKSHLARYIKSIKRKYEWKDATLPFHLNILLCICHWQILCSQTPRWSLCVEIGGAISAKMTFFIMVFNVCELMSWGLDKRRSLQCEMNHTKVHKKGIGLRQMRQYKNTPHKTRRPHK